MLPIPGNFEGQALGGKHGAALIELDDSTMPGPGTSWEELDIPLSVLARSRSCLQRGSGRPKLIGGTAKSHACAIAGGSLVRHVRVMNENDLD